MIQAYESNSDVDRAQAISEFDVRSVPPSMLNCDAVIVAFQSRRFAILRLDRDKKKHCGIVRSVEQLCKPTRNLMPGENVYYKGRIERLIAIEPY